MFLLPDSLKCKGFSSTPYIWSDKSLPRSRWANRLTLMVLSHMARSLVVKMVLDVLNRIFGFLNTTPLSRFHLKSQCWSSLGSGA